MADKQVTVRVSDRWRVVHDGTAYVTSAYDSLKSLTVRARAITLLSTMN